MTARIIDGKAIAAALRARVADEVKRLSAQHGLTPGLAVVLAGNNPASESYVGSKAKATKEAGMTSFDHRLPDSVSQAELMALVQKAMITELGPQCGFCTSGQVVAAVALLNQNPTPTVDEARRGMSGNLCRCGAYDHYLNAVMRVAREA